MLPIFIATILTLSAHANEAPTISTAASSAPNPVPGTTAVLSVVSADDGGASALTYTWVSIGTPPAVVVFAPNGNNAAKSSTATFAKAGDYQFQVTVRDSSGLTTTSSVVVTVNQTPTSIAVSPDKRKINPLMTQQYSANAKDQFGHLLSVQPLFTWATSGGGSINSSGLFTAGSADGGPFTISASVNGITGNSSLRINGAPRILNSSASSNPVTGASVSLSARGEDDAELEGGDGGEGNITYTWSTTGIPPASVSFLVNGTHAAKNTTATFSKSGDYVFQVMVQDHQGRGVIGTVSLTVQESLSSIAISPQTVSVGTAGTQQFTASALSQFGNVLVAQPSIVWSVNGGGTISNSGIFTAGTTVGGPFIITAAHQTVSGHALVTIAGNGAPSIANAASAASNPVTGTAVTLNVLGSDNSGEENLTYTWAVIGIPPAPATFSANGNNAAKNTHVVFSAAGNYTFQVNVTDADGFSVVSAVNLVVNQTLASVSVSPPQKLINLNGSQQFSATSYDQFGTLLATQPATTWSVDGGGGIDGNGLFTAGQVAGGPFAVAATSGPISGTAAVLIVDAPPTVATAANANSNPVTTAQTTLSTLGADDGGEPTLRYTWALTGTPPAPVTFSVNGTHEARTTVALFTAPGSYHFDVTITDMGNQFVVSSVVVTVESNLASIAITPAVATITLRQSQQFSAVARDQFGSALAVQPALSWAANGGGTIDNVGLFTAGTIAGGPFNITATSGTSSGTANITVTNSAPTVATVSAATPNPVTGTSTALSVLGADDAGEENLKYCWAVIGNAPGPVGFSVNDSNSAKNTVTTFAAAGVYTFQVTVVDGDGLTAVNSIVVTVQQTLTAILVSPNSATVPLNGTRQFAASGADQFGAAMGLQPAFTWSTNGGGSINAVGLFTASANPGGPFTITATNGAISGTAAISVFDAPPTVAQPATANPAIVTGTTSNLSVRGDDDEGGTTLVYTWSVVGGTPAAVSFSANGTPEASNTVATFNAPGAYTIEVTIRDSAGLTAVSTLIVNVQQTFTSLLVAPASAIVTVNNALQFTALASDQFGGVLNPQPAFTWGVSGGGVVNGTGLFTAGPTAGGPFILSASSGDKSGSASISIASAAQAVSIIASDANASENGVDTGIFTITRQGDTAAALNVEFSVAGTATSGTDYTSLGTSVTIAAGFSSATLIVTPQDDASAETAETIVVTLTENAQYTIVSPNTATITLSDDEPRVSIIASDPIASEPGTDTGTLTISRTGSLANSLTVTFSVDGTANSGTDYTGIGTTVTIPEGMASAVLIISPLDDAIVEVDETVTVTLLEQAGYEVVTPTAATVVVTDDEPVVTIVASDATAAEPTTDTGEFIISRTGSTANALIVSYSVSGTASVGTDFTAIGTSIGIPAGESSVTIKITPIDDATAENDETIVVSINTSTAYSIETPAFATVSLIDNELPTVNVTALDATSTEPGVDTGTFIVTRVGNTLNPLSVLFTVGGTASSATDYTAIGTSVVIPAGSNSQFITVSPINDSVIENIETVVVTLSTSATYTRIAPFTATIDVLDDEPHISIAATDATAGEQGADTGTFTLTRSGSLAAPMTVNFTVSGTATSNVDYISLGSSITIPAEVATATLTVQPLNNTVAESNETITITLSTSTLYGLTAPTVATVTIVDDDPALVTIVATDANATEPGTDTGLFTVTRVGNTDSALNVSYGISGTATNEIDIQALSGIVTIPAGSTTGLIPISVLNDGVAEPKETVVATLIAGAGYTLGAANTATVTITDDEQWVTVAVSDNTATEANATTGSFTITRAGVTGTPLIVNYTLTGTASNGVDYTNLNASTTIFAGQTSAIITVTPINDTLYEGNESVELTLAPGAGYTVGTTNTGTINLIDNDVVATIAATDATASEPGTDIGVFTITLNHPALSDTLVQYTFSGTAVSGSDYPSLVTSVNIPTGASTATVTITPIDNSAGENDETLIATLSASTFYTVGTPNSATITITDDDPPTISITASDASAGEEGLNTGTFTFIRTGNSQASLTVNCSTSGVAQSGIDYVALPTTVTFPAGATTTTVTVVPIEDNIYEPTEFVTLRVNFGAGYSTGAPISASVSILDNEPLVSAQVLDAQANESGDTGTFTITRTGSTAEPLVVSIAMNGVAVAGIDYLSPGATVAIPAGAASTTIAIVPLEDLETEFNELITLNIIPGISHGVGTPSSASMTLIENDETEIYFDTDVASADEGGVAQIIVRRVGNLLLPTTLNYTATSGTAVIGTDFVAPSGTVTIGAGSAQSTITIAAIDDSLTEGPETLSLTLVSGNGYHLRSNSITGAVVTVVDSEQTVIVDTSSNPVATESGTKNGVFTFSRLSTVNLPLIVNYTVAGTASPGIDYSTLSGSVTIPAGSGSTTVFISAISDGVEEPDETIILTLSNNPAYAIGNSATATVTIAAPNTISVQAAQPIAREPSTQGSFVISRTGNIDFETSVSFSRSGTATSASDFNALPTSVLLPAGAASVSIPVIPIDDTLQEGSETVVLTLTVKPDYRLGVQNSATVNIVDDELQSGLLIPDPFNANAFTNDPDYRNAYLAGLEPGRVWLTAQGAPGTPALKTTSPLQKAIASNAQVLLSVTSVPNAPVTFYCTGEGQFIDNDRNVITVQANALGEASVTYKAPTGGRIPILAGSPLTVGVVRFLIKVGGQQ